MLYYNYKKFHLVYTDIETKYCRQFPIYSKTTKFSPNPTSQISTHSLIQQKLWVLLLVGVDLNNQLALVIFVGASAQNYSAEGHA